MPEKIDLLDRIASNARKIYEFLLKIYNDYRDKGAIEAYSIYIAVLNEGWVRVPMKDRKGREVPILTQEVIKRITGVSPYRVRKVWNLVYTSPEEVKKKVHEFYGSLYEE